MEEGDDLKGQFEFVVGFYSSFLVADTAVVTSKNNDDEQYIWWVVDTELFDWNINCDQARK